MMAETNDYLMDREFKDVRIRPTMPRRVGWLLIAPEVRVVCFEWPNLWRRFWCWALLGWHWERE